MWTFKTAFEFDNMLKQINMEFIEDLKANIAVIRKKNGEEIFPIRLKVRVITYRNPRVKRGEFFLEVFLSLFRQSAVRNGQHSVRVFGEFKIVRHNDNRQIFALVQI